jgi:hypothetical protein
VRLSDSGAYHAGYEECGFWTYIGGEETFGGKEQPPSEDKRTSSPAFTYGELDGSSKKMIDKMKRKLENDIEKNLGL